ncbi:MAG: hypothetical protein MJZ79_07050 [Paludibacteraceae bacterium]|nr:hypothetical protein [Paludibacteraceae bacterium]
MKTAELKVVAQSDNVSLYSICFDGAQETEFEKFIARFKDNATVNHDFRTILLALERILGTGVLERYFRTEGRMNDNLCALSIDSRKLRLYCLRISDQILIAGNGGIKETKTYQESNELSGYVMNLQQFDRILKQAQAEGAITIEENIIKGIEGKVFEK